MISATHENVSTRPIPPVGLPVPRWADGMREHRFRPPPEHGRRALNVSALCVDRHLGECPDHVAVLAHGVSGEEAVCFRELHERVCRLANALTDQGVQRGDRVAIHLPLMVESIVAVLACARIGAVHVLLGIHADAPRMAGQLADCGAVAVLTGDATCDGAGQRPLKAMLDRALEMAGTRSRVKLVLLVTLSSAEVAMKPGRDHHYDAVVDWYEPDYPPEAMYGDDPQFLSYPPARRGGAHGVTHTVGEYRHMVSHAMEMAHPYTDVDVPPTLVNMAWDAGQTPLLVGLLAQGRTITTTAEVPMNVRI
ncbi:AMP-binding protein [Novacetimonas maltaceti]|uniref:Acetyl-coenzyme A synthetase n=1 Tax=Novacetimonas maltaceti TaxID=1203393 RepID=A0A2S3W2H0_9PROT|nr:AMP-binding protein [Novacetimonas maltaceti]POF63082.1 Acetyl-coenzyme A synthetase [Novacetimonas maltaceti]